MKNSETESDTEQMKNDYRRRWSRYDKWSNHKFHGNQGCGYVNARGNQENENSRGHQENENSRGHQENARVKHENENSRGNQEKSYGYQCKMSINPALNRLINSGGQIEGRIKKKNGDITLDLTPVYSFKSDRSVVDRERIFRKMDYLESELDAIACIIKKEVKRQIKQAERKEKAPVEEEEYGDEEGETEEEGGETEEEDEESRTGKFKEVSKTVHKEKKINENGVEETIITTTRERVEDSGTRKTRVITTTEEHKIPGGGGYTIVTTEKTVKGGKHNGYKMIKTEMIRSRDNDLNSDAKANCDSNSETKANSDFNSDAKASSDVKVNSDAKAPMIKQEEKVEEVTYAEETKSNDVIKAAATETQKGQKPKEIRGSKTK